MKESAKYKHSSYTPAKQMVWRKSITSHMAICKAIWEKYPKWKLSYRIFDLFAGPGIDPDGQMGSWRIALDIYDNDPIDRFRLELYECDPVQLDCLKRSIPDQHKRKIGVKPYDHRYLDVIYPDRLLSKSVYGIQYHDPSNADLSISTMKRLHTCYPHVDIMVNLAFATMKRIDKAPHANLDYSIDEIMEVKKRWFIREPMGKHQWSMLMGTDWDTPEAFASWEYVGWAHTASALGIEWLDRCRLTVKERIHNGQPSLF